MKAAAVKAARADASKGGGSLSWVQGLLCGALFAVAPTTMALIVLLLGPALAMIFIEPDRTRPVGRAMLLLAAAASVAPVRGAMLSGSGGAVFGVCEPADIALAWAAAGGGWLLAQLVPLGAGLVVDALAKAERSRLTAEAAALRVTWGEAG